MEKFMVLTTTTEQRLAAQTTEALEGAGIPVMIEHVEIVAGDEPAYGFRVLVPSQHTQNALRLISRREGLGTSQLMT